jgi:anti-anti-sigma factor
LRSAQSTLSVTVRPEGESDGERLVVRLVGELDITSSPLLQAVVEQACASRRTPLCRHLVVDMSGVEFADASGISPLLLARATLARRNGTIELRNCRRSVRRLLRLLGLEELATEGDAPRPFGPAVG